MSLHLVQNLHRKLVDLSWGKTNLKLLSGARFLGGILYNRDRYSLNSDNGCLVLMIDCQAKTTVGDWWSGPLLYCIILECKPSATLFYEQSIKDWVIMNDKAAILRRLWIAMMNELRFWRSLHIKTNCRSILAVSLFWRKSLTHGRGVCPRIQYITTLEVVVGFGEEDSYWHLVEKLRSAHIYI